jgi:hypothetical protein
MLRQGALQDVRERSFAGVVKGLKSSVTVTCDQSDEPLRLSDVGGGHAG